MCFEFLRKKYVFDCLGAYICLIVLARLEEDRSGETKAEAEGEETGVGAGAGEGSVYGLERVSATMFSGPGTWTTELVNSAR